MSVRALDPKQVRSGDIEEYSEVIALRPNYNWNRAIPSFGAMNVDTEERINFRRMHNYRLARTRQALKNSECGALLLLDPNNVRYITSSKIGEWSRDKMTSFCMLAGDGEPVLWDFGSAALHHKMHMPWLEPDNCRAGNIGLRGTIPPHFGLMEYHAKEFASILKENGVADLPVGVDLIEPALLHYLEKEGIKIVDGQQVMLEAREIKNCDEIALLNRAAGMVDAVYHMVSEELKPGVRENDIVARANKLLYELGSDDVEAINAISGERCSPHPHNFTDRMIRPGDQAYFDVLQSYMGYRTCYYRTFAVGKATPSQHDAYKKAREWVDASIAMIKPGVSTDKVAAVWPKAEEFGFPSELSAFGLQFGHGLGTSIHERPIISRLVSMDHPMEIKEGMVFALETFCAASDGFSGARIEEEVVVTNTGCRIISLFPAEELPIANRY